MIILTWMTFRLCFISIIPNMIGDRTSVYGNIAQTLILIMMALMSALAYGKYKFLSIILFVIYSCMFIGCFFSFSSHDVFTIIISIGGIATTYRSVEVTLDYKQLTQTEGFPYFNIRLVEQEENSTYIPTYEKAYYSSGKKDMDSSENLPKQSVADKEEDTEEIEVDMPEISLNLSSVQNITSEIFVPEHNKFCCMSDSPHKIQ